MSQEQFSDTASVPTDEGNVEPQGTGGQAKDHTGISEERRAQAMNFLFEHGLFEPEYSTTPEGVRYLSRGSDGIVYSGPDDVGSYDF